MAKVLVVDDEEQIRDLFHNFLTASGYEVSVASNGEEAIQMAICGDPDVVVLDLNMPGIGGMETCNRLRAEERTRLVPIIILTGFGPSQLGEDDAGADDLVNKPIRMADLLLRIKAALSIREIDDPVERLLVYLHELQQNRLEARTPPESDLLL